MHFTTGGSFLLRFYFVADTDTTLIINDPSGNWVCSDDVFGTLNPGIDFGTPEGGIYDIWIGTIAAESPIEGTLHVTELQDNHP